MGTNAINYFAPRQDRLKRNQFGAVVWRLSRRLDFLLNSGINNESGKCTLAPPKEELRMLKSIDILTGLSVVMLVASMAVTVMTGFITHIRNTRGRNLQQGIADMLQLLDPLSPKMLSTRSPPPFLRIR